MVHNADGLSTEQHSFHVKFRHFSYLIVSTIMSRLYKLVDTLVGHFCITFLSFAIYSVLCL